MSDLYRRLGVDRDASPEEIRAAHRRAASRAHPDRQGGSKEDFYEIQLAYEVLSDPRRKARYDLDGVVVDPLKERREMALRALAGILIPAIDVIDVRKENIVEGLRRATSARRDECLRAIEKAHEAIDRRKKVVERLTRKGGKGTNALVGMIEADIAGYEEAIKTMDEELEIVKIRFQILDEYEYRVDPPEPAAGPGQGVVPWKGGLH